MAGTNDFKAIATGGGANVITQSAYTALTTFLSNGYSSGVVASNQFNKIIRQSSFVSAGIGKIIADANLDALDDGDLATFSANLLTALTGRLINIQVFSTAGTSTYTPTAGTKSVVVEVVGGGGAGGGVPTTTASQVAVGAGGCGGAVACSRLTSGFSGVTITVGAAGTGSAGATGGNGGTSSFGALLSASGGAGGVAGSASSGSGLNGNGTAPTATGGNLYNIPGQIAKLGVLAYGSVAYGGDGGSSPYGSGGSGFSTGPGTSSGAGLAAGGKGAGGGGALAITSSGTALAGGNGTSGIVIVREYA